MYLFCFSKVRYVIKCERKVDPNQKFGHINRKIEMNARATTPSHLLMNQKPCCYTKVQRLQKPEKKGFIPALMDICLLLAEAQSAHLCWLVFS